MVTKVRQRVAQETKGHRGRKDNLAWAHRLLLLRAGDRLSERAVHRLDRVFVHDDATDEIGAAWGVKERVRMLLACTDLDAADTARGQLGITVLAADMPETWRLSETINDCWDEIETLHRNQSHERPDRGREHRHQAHQAHRTGLPQPPPLPAPYPAAQPPADTPAAHTLESSGHRGQLRIACNRHPTRLARFPTGLTYSIIGI